LKFIIIAIFAGFTILTARAEKPCMCTVLSETPNEQQKFLQNLQTADLEFSDFVINSEVGEIVEGRYYYCDENHGYLHIKLRDKEKIYKEVPLTTWFEFKFNESLEQFYKSKIKYAYIAI
jgi:hypothetical protein